MYAAQLAFEEFHQSPILLRPCGKSMLCKPIDIVHCRKWRSWLTVDGVNWSHMFRRVSDRQAQLADAHADRLFARRGAEAYQVEVTQRATEACIVADECDAVYLALLAEGEEDDDG